MTRFAVIFTLLCFLYPATGHTKVLDIQVLRDTEAMKIWLVEDSSVPVISMQFAFVGRGSRNDPNDKQGLNRMLANTLDEGAGDLDAKAFQKELSDNSIELSFSTTRDDFTGTVYTLSREKERAFQLLSSALSAPRFDEEAVERMRAQNIARIRSSMTDPEWMLARLQNSVLFQNHSYAKNSGGTLSSLPTITPKDLRAAHQSLKSAPLRIAFSGNISPEEALKIVDHVFKGYAQAVSQTQISTAASPLAQTVLYTHTIPQTLVTMALPAPTPRDKDYVSVEVMNYIFGGGGFGSRLTDVIRERNGLTYGIYSGFEHLDAAHYILISSSSKNETIARLIQLTRDELNRMKQTPPTEEEVRDAVRYLRGSTLLGLSSNPRLSSFMLGLMLEELPADYLDQRDVALQNIDAQAVHKAAQKWLDSSKLVTIMLGAPVGLEPSQKVDTLPYVE
jgi:zinc protease